MGTCCSKVQAVPPTINTQRYSRKSKNSIKSLKEYNKTDTYTGDINSNKIKNNTPGLSGQSNGGLDSPYIQSLTRSLTDSNDENYSFDINNNNNNNNNNNINNYYYNYTNHGKFPLTRHERGGSNKVEYINLAEKLSMTPDTTKLAVDLNVPHKRLDINPLFGNLFLNSTKYENKRQYITKTCESIEYINNITFNVDHWLIFSDISIAIEKCEKILDIVAWRLPVIPAWSLSTFEEYKKLMDRECVQYTGIWDIMTKNNFVRQFLKNTSNVQEIIEQITFVDNMNDDYLIDNDYMVFESETKEYKQFWYKLKKIIGQQISQILIVGERQAAEKLILEIRQSEIEHPSMTPFIKTDGTFIHPLANDVTREPMPSVMKCYQATIKNIPYKDDIQDTDLLTFLTDNYNVQINHITFVKNSNSNNNNNKENKNNKNNFAAIAHVEFGNERSQKKIYKISQSSQGIEFKKRMLSVTIPDKVKQVRRKIKRVSSQKLLF